MEKKKTHPLEQLIALADTAINEEDFDTLLDMYADDAVLVIQPGRLAVGKEQIRAAFEAIAAYFGHSLRVSELGMEILETGDTALVLARTLVEADNLPAMRREATYVFRKMAEEKWVCAIDNSYGHTLLDVESAS